MHANTILALVGLVNYVAAVPFASQHYRLHNHKRYLVWETVTEEVIQTIPVTKTIWLEPGETPPTIQPAHHNQAPKAPAHHHHNHQASPAAPAFTPPAVTPAAPVNTPPAVVSPVAAPVPTSTYIAPAAPPAPVASSSSSAPYVPPAPAPSTPSSGGSSGGGSGWTKDMSLPASAPAGLTFGMGKAGTSYTGDLTYYAIGMGACGTSNTEDQAVVAISHIIFDSYNDNGNPNANPLCGKYVTITDANGNKRYHQIVDRCVGCDSGDLDLPEGFFNSITDNGDGRVAGMHWEFT